MEKRRHERAHDQKRRNRPSLRELGPSSRTGVPSLIRTDYADSIRTIAFDNYAKRNALSADLIEEVIATLDRFKAQGARAVVLGSARDEEVWSSGHDVYELPKANIDRRHTATRSIGNCERSNHS